MTRKPSDVDDFDFEGVAAVLQESDDAGVLLRGHLWIESLLERAAIGKLERPHAIDWKRARFEHKLAIAEAVGAVSPDIAAAIRGFNSLRNQLAHELTFEVSADAVKTLIGRIESSGTRKSIQSMIENQLAPMREIDRAREQGWEVEIDPALEWYPRVMTESRAQLFALVYAVLRDLALTVALDTMEHPATALAHLDSTLRRLTGGLFSFNPTPAKQV